MDLNTIISYTDSEFKEFIKNNGLLKLKEYIDKYGGYPD